MLFDISMVLQPGMLVWPGDPNVSFDNVCSMARGDECNVTRVSLGVHSGTHVDAPKHFIDDGIGVADMSLDLFVGPCAVMEISDTSEITARHLQTLVPEGVERLLLRTDNSQRMLRSDAFDKSFVSLSKDAAMWICQRGIRLVGIDYLSVESFHCPPGNPVHRILLEGNVALLEGLVLAHVPAGQYELFAAPVKLSGADGAPCRAVLRTVD
ncbi:MAG: cyclase family protein [Deltaproteobacteria bacterium]|nr:cyclase family protein [Deltaproteobacteria bacterium]MBN2674142.1 cyclase family protein [Deltaproteobacteria bacterium]